MTKYELSEADNQLLDNWFYHKPNGDQIGRYDLINTATRDLVRLVMENCPPSRQRSTAITQIELTRMSANAAIACNE